MQELPEPAGSKIKDDRILNFKAVLWLPENNRYEQTKTKPLAHTVLEIIICRY